MADFGRLKSTQNQVIADYRDNRAKGKIIKTKLCAERQD